MASHSSARRSSGYSTDALRRTSEAPACGTSHTRSGRTLRTREWRMVQGVPTPDEAVLIRISIQFDRLGLPAFLCLVPQHLPEHYFVISVAPRLVSVPAHAHPRFARYASTWEGVTARG